MLRIIKYCAAILALCSAVVSVNSEAAPEIKAEQWEGIYRSSTGDVMRIQAAHNVISIDIFVRQNESWKLTTQWATIMTKPNYAEFRQRAEPDGLWLSLSLNAEGALLEEHDQDSQQIRKNLYKKLTDTESQRVLGLPQ